MAGQGKPIAVVLCDGHEMLLDGLSALLSRETDLRLAGVAPGVDAALELCRATRPDVLVLGLAAGQQDGAEVARRVRAACPLIRIVVLAEPSQTDTVRAAFDAGASGFLFKTSGYRVLAAAVRTVAGGRTFLDRASTDLVVDQFVRRTPPSAGLAERERQLVTLVAAGLSAKEIAAEMAVSVKTVERMRARILASLGLRSVADLVKYAVREGMSPG